LYARAPRATAARTARARAAAAPARMQLDILKPAAGTNRRRLSPLCENF
jgi:hypothetical protein